MDLLDLVCANHWLEHIGSNIVSTRGDSRKNFEIELWLFFRILVFVLAAGEHERRRRRLVRASHASATARAQGPASSTRPMRHQPAHLRESTHGGALGDGRQQAGTHSGLQPNAAGQRPAAEKVLLASLNSG